MSTNCLAKGRALANSWTKVKHGEEHINMPSCEDRRQLASVWVEASEKGDWERFASQCALIPSNLIPHK